LKTVATRTKDEQKLLLLLLLLLDRITYVYIIPLLWREKHDQKNINSGKEYCSRYSICTVARRCSLDPSLSPKIYYLTLLHVYGLTDCVWTFINYNAYMYSNNIIGVNTSCKYILSNFKWVSSIIWCTTGISLRSSTFFIIYKWFAPNF